MSKQSWEQKIKFFATGAGPVVLPRGVGGEKPPTKNRENKTEKRTKLNKTDSGDALIEIFLPAENIDFDAKELNINITSIKAGHADGIFFCCDNEFSACGFCIVNKIDQFLLTVSMVVREMAFEHEDSSEVFEEAFETGWIGDGRD